MRNQLAVQHVKIAVAKTSCVARNHRDTESAADWRVVTPLLPSLSPYGALQSARWISLGRVHPLHPATGAVRKQTWKPPDELVRVRVT